MKSVKTCLPRALALVLTAALLLCAMPLSAFAAKESVKHYDIYTCLGDSHAAGYGTTGYVYSRLPAPNAYHSLVAEATGAQLIDYGVGGFRTHEVSYMLDPDYEMDWGYAELTDGDCHKEQIDEYREAYRQAVIDADLITVQLGSNDFSGYLGNIIAKLYMPNETIEALKAQFAGDGAVNQAMTAILGYADQAIRIITFVVDMVVYCLDVMKNYGADFDEVMGNIFRLNPDATVVVVGNFNPLNNAYLELGGVKLPVGKLFDVVFSAMNLWEKYGSQYVGKYIFVDVYDMQFGSLNLMDFGDSDILFGAVHQHDEGHAEIARRILNALPA